MGREFVARKSSVWTKKSDTKPSLFASRPFSVQTREQNTVNKKELPKEIPSANYITDKMGLNASQPTVQRQEDNSDKEQEPDLISKSDASPVADEGEKEETISPKLEDKNKEEKLDLKTVADEEQKQEDIVSPSLEDENKQEDLDNQSIQTKLTVGEPGDKYEQEADTVAAKVVEQINSPKSPQPVQGKVEPVVQPTLMRQGGAGKGTVNRDVEQNIQQARGGGQRLADNVRQPMEQAFGADFSGVKVHTGGQADVLNRSLNSRAFATGQDIFFKQGEYNPGSKQGQELLAHELTHVVQQGGGVKQIQRQPNIRSQFLIERAIERNYILGSKLKWESQVDKIVTHFQYLGFLPPLQTPNSRTFAYAVRQYQQRNPRLKNDGILDSKTWHQLKADLAANQQQITEGEPTTPPWITIAQAEIGVREISGKRHHPRIIEYHSATGGFSDDETPWCASFVNWVLQQAGQEGTGSARALSFRSYGRQLERPAYGSIAVFSYGGGRGHIGFVVGHQGNKLLILGGNQGNQVQVRAYNTSQIIAYVVPRGYQVASTAYNLVASEQQVTQGGGVAETR